MADGQLLDGIVDVDGARLKTESGPEFGVDDGGDARRTVTRQINRNPVGLMMVQGGKYKLLRGHFGFFNLRCYLALRGEPESRYSAWPPQIELITHLTTLRILQPRASCLYAFMTFGFMPHRLFGVSKKIWRAVASANSSLYCPWAIFRARTFAICLRIMNALAYDQSAQ